MARTLKIPTPVGDVTARLTRPKRAVDTAILLAHGAGAGQDHPWMVAMRDRLGAAGFTTMTFDYAYTATGRKAPDRLPKLVEVHTAAAQRLAKEFEAVILAGKSMGGRVGGHVAAEGRFPAVGVVYLGYPLVAMGKTEPRDTSHLLTVGVPQLFISGTRDPMGPNDLVERVASSVPDGRFIAVDGGDHSLVPLKRSGRTLDDALDNATAAIAQWWSDGAP